MKGNRKIRRIIKDPDDHSAFVQGEWGGVLGAHKRVPRQDKKKKKLKRFLGKRPGV